LFNNLASREGQQARELQPSVIRKHIEDVGLPGDIADHVIKPNFRMLSVGYQAVKRSRLF
jgi:hypothetical protein